MQSLRDQEEEEEVAKETEQHPGRQGETQKGLVFWWPVIKH